MSTIGCDLGCNIGLNIDNTSYCHSISSHFLRPNSTKFAKFVTILLHVSNLKHLEQFRFFTSNLCNKQSLVYHGKRELIL